MSRESVANGIRRVRTQLEKFGLHDYGHMYNETATRYALIDPVLKGLGWDITNMDQCTVELEMPQARRYRRADCVLHDSNGNIGIIIEAKAANQSLTGKVLDEAENQLADCAGALTLGAGVITNGLIWRLYHLDSTQAPLSDRLTEVVDIRDRDGSIAGSARMLHEWLNKDNWW